MTRADPDAVYCELPERGDRATRSHLAPKLLLPLLLASLVPATGCAQAEVDEATRSGVQQLLVGPDPAVMEGVDYRFRLAVPSAYMPPEFINQLVPNAPIPRVLFVAAIDNFAPAGTRKADGADVFSGAIGWMAPDYVRSAIDGTKLSSFSQYELPDGDRYGLQTRKTRMDQVFPAKLYVRSSDNESVMIECAYAPAPDRPQFCQLWSEKRDLPLLELYFRQEDLPQWERLLAGAEGLMKSWLASTDEQGGGDFR